MVTAVAALSVLALAIGYFAWWTKPTKFAGVGNGFGTKQTVGSLHPVTFDMIQPSVHDDPETIAVHEVVPRVVRNTADALITVRVCERVGMPFMSADGEAELSCELVREVENQRVRFDSRGMSTITMTVTPRRKGRVLIDGIDIHYARGAAYLWQRGGQATGPVVRVRVTE